MTPEQFTYWLQGFLELQNPETLDTRQIQILKDHLQLVFNKQTPDRDILKKNLNPEDIEDPQSTAEDFSTLFCSPRLC